MENFVICKKCEALLIVDEFTSHECSPNHRFEGDYLYTRRKGRWRRIYLPFLGINQPRDNTHKNSRQDNSTILKVLLPCELIFSVLPLG